MSVALTSAPANCSLLGSFDVTDGFVVDGAAELGAGVAGSTVSAGGAVDDAELGAAGDESAVVVAGALTVAEWLAAWLSMVAALSLPPHPATRAAVATAATAARNFFTVSPCSFGARSRRVSTPGRLTLDAK
jgi:hypothetical protein